MLTFPVGLLPVSQTMFVRQRASKAVSPWSGAVQTYEQPNSAAWVAEMEFDLEARKAGEMDAFLQRLKGGAVSARVPNFKRPVPVSGIADKITSISEENFEEGFPFVEGFGFVVGTFITAEAAPARAQMITTSGWPMNEEILLPGDTFEVGAGVLCQYAGSLPLRSDQFGAASIAISPPLSAAVEAAAIVNVILPAAAMLLASGDAAENPTVKPARTRYSIQFIEDRR